MVNSRYLILAAGLVVLSLVAVGAFVFGQKNDSTGATPAPNQTNPSPLSDSQWSWRYTDLQSGERIEAPAGDRFVLSFDRSEGRVQSTTDCNSLSGVYVEDNEVVSFGQFVSTLMYCENSKENEYQQELSLVTSYTIAGDQLQFHLNRDYGVMVFERLKDKEDNGSGT